MYCRSVVAPVEQFWVAWGMEQYLMIKIISSNRKNDRENEEKGRESRKNVCVGEGKICGNRTRGYEKID